MNKFIYLFVTLFAISFSSCNNEDASQGVETITPATLKLTIAGIGVNTKATGLTATDGSVGSSEATVNSMIVGVFKCTQSTPNDNDPLDKITEIPTASLGASISVDGLTAGDRSVIVVTNYDDAAKTALLAAKTRGEFLAKTIKLSVTTGSTTTTAGSTQVATYLPMSGEAKVGTNNVIKLNAATNNADVTLSRLVAKISINSINTAFIAPYANATFNLNKIFIYGALESSTVAVGTNSTVPSAVTLINGGTVSGSTWAVEKPYLLDAGSLCSFSPVTPIVTSYSTAHSFYVFANGNGTYPLKLVLGGEFDMDGAGTVAASSTTYYPIIINQTTPTSSTGVVDRNTIYNVTATIKGIGVANPSENILPANLTLSVTPAPWTTSNQTVEFN